MNNFDKIKPLSDKIDSLLLDIKEIKPNLYREYTLIVDDAINGFIDLGAEYIKDNPQEFEIFLKKLNDVIKILEFIKSRENLRENYPYTDIEATDKYIIREFNENIDPIELLWHRDDEDRTIEILGETDWKLQLDDELPTSLNQPIFIPRHHWHRVIKGNGNLKLKIHLD